MAAVAVASPPHLQEREQELAAREDQLEAWKAQFKAEAVRQVGAQLHGGSACTSMCLVGQLCWPALSLAAMHLPFCTALAIALFAEHCACLTIPCTTRLRSASAC